MKNLKLLRIHLDRSIFVDYFPSFLDFILFCCQGYFIKLSEKNY